MRSEAPKKPTYTTVSSSQTNKSPDNEYIKHLKEKFNCALDDMTLTILLKTISAEHFKAVYNKAKKLRRLFAMHQQPKHWMPLLDPRRIIVMTGEPEALEAYLEQRSLTIKELFDYDPELLHYAAIGGNVKMMKQLVASGYHPDGHDGYSMSPLMYATLFGHQDAVVYLIGCEANPKHLDKFGRNCYHFAAFSADQTLMAKFQNLGIDPNENDYFDTTSEHFIAWGGHSISHRSLQTPLTDPNSPGASTIDGITLWHAQLVGGLIMGSNENKKAIHDALRADEHLHEKLAVPIYPYTFSMLSGDDFFDLYKHKKLALLEAAKCNNLHIYNETVTSLKAFLSHNLTRDEQCTLVADDKTGCTPIHHFAMSHGLAGLKTCYKSLNDKDTFYNTLDKDGNNVILCAASGGSVAVMKWCLEQSSKPEDLIQSTNNKGETAMHAAARSPNPEMVRVCIEHGLAIDTRDKNGKTPMMHALASSTLPVIKVLMAGGAKIENIDPIATNPNPSTIHWALHQADLLPLDKNTLTDLEAKFSGANNILGCRYLKALSQAEESLRYLSEHLDSGDDIVDKKVLQTLVNDIEASLYKDTSKPPEWTTQCDRLLQSLPALSGARFKPNKKRRDKQINKMRTHLEQVKQAAQLNIHIKLKPQNKAKPPNLRLS